MINCDMQNFQPFFFLFNSVVALLYVLGFFFQNRDTPPEKKGVPNDVILEIKVINYNTKRSFFLF